MAVDDYLEPEVAIAVAVTAAVASPPVRKVIRRGLVYGLAGLLVAKDKITAVGQNVAQGARQMATSAGAGAQRAAGEPARATQGATS
jgi:hypothetical protein